MQTDYQQRTQTARKLHANNACKTHASQMPIMHAKRTQERKQHMMHKKRDKLYLDSRVDVSKLCNK
jgi:hypothetical protein